uniref:Poly [ADP-ribose] polymerase 2 n=1 Tax=Lygus hesperus TaxID=30085 RepID=A0A0A9ZEA7_LYGHE
MFTLKLLSFAVFLSLYAFCTTDDVKPKVIFFPNLNKDDKKYILAQINKGQDKWIHQKKKGPEDQFPKALKIIEGTRNETIDEEKVKTIYEFKFLSETKEECEGRLKYSHYKVAAKRASVSYRASHCKEEKSEK